MHCIHSMRVDWGLFIFSILKRFQAPTFKQVKLMRGRWDSDGNSNLTETERVFCFPLIFIKKKAYVSLEIGKALHHQPLPTEDISNCCECWLYPWWFGWYSTVVNTGLSALQIIIIRPKHNGNISPSWQGG